MDILIEGHGRFDVPTAVRVGRELEQFDILWFEEPIPPGDLDALAEVRRRIRVPVAAGERLYSRWDAMQFLKKGCADYIQPDVSHIGGISELKKVAAMAEAKFIQVCPHNPSGPVANAATLQLAGCTTNFFLLETMSSDVPYRSQLTTENVVLKDGKMAIPDRPGLGIDLIEDAIAEHPYQPVSLRHYTGTLTEIRPSDAVDYRK